MEDALMNDLFLISLGNSEAARILLAAESNQEGSWICCIELINGVVILNMTMKPIVGKCLLNPIKKSGLLHLDL